MQIFLVVASDVEGNNRDQVVWAETAERALDLWKAYMIELLRETYDEDDMPSDEALLEAEFNHENVRVFNVEEPDGEEKVLPWVVILEVSL
jgi:hypothetical protein